MPDNIIYLDGDDASTDDGSNTSEANNDVEMAGAMPEDLENLRIDMRRRHVFNVSFFNKGKQGS